MLITACVALLGLGAIAFGVGQLVDVDGTEDAPPAAPPAGPRPDTPKELRQLLDRIPDMKPHEADEAVRELAGRDARTLPALLEILKSPFASSVELQEALAAITSIGPPALPDLLVYFLESDGKQARRAYTAVRHLIPTAGQWKGGQANPFARAWTAAHAEAARPHEAALLERLRDPNGNVRRYAILIIAALPPAARSEASTPALVDAFAQDDAVVRAEASYALMVSGTKARDAVPRLVRFLDRDDEEMRDLTFAVLARLGRDVPEVATLLVERLERVRAGEVQTSICVALAQMGENARPALPWFEEALTSGDAALGRTAVNCLVTLDGLGLPLLLRALEHTDPLSRRLAAQALGMLGARATPEAEAALEARTGDEDPEVARRAREALERIAKARKG